MLVIEARDYVGGAIVVTALVALALAGIRVVVDRLLDRRGR